MVNFRAFGLNWGGILFFEDQSIVLSRSLVHATM
uniref:Uncharacterized protein n=1 Tax=Rhizophora mucronata TaxID=61149 RepID=A0A2P2L9J4_RHIMU